jgi:hypothetical protein
MRAAYFVVVSEIFDETVFRDSAILASDKSVSSENIYECHFDITLS